jgi:hypothetical protein
VAIQAPLLNLLNRKAGYINERLRYIASSLPRLTYTPTVYNITVTGTSGDVVGTNMKYYNLKKRL